MSFLALILLMLIELWITTLILLVAHRFSLRFGLAPLFIVIGALTGALHFPSLPPLIVEFAGWSRMVFPASFLFLPPLLLGLLLIYIGEGTIQARSTLVGILVVAVLAGAFRLIPPSTHTSAWLQVYPADPVQGASPRILFASFVTLALDQLVLVLTYQSISNLRVRDNSRLAAVSALLAALWCDALVFTLVAYIGTPQLGQLLLFGLLGKTIAGLILIPVLLLYVTYMPQFFPKLATATPRPVFDIFTTTRQLEARAIFHFSLLQTLLQVNQLIVHTTDPQELIDQTCHLLVANRDYRLVWAALFGKHPGMAKAGRDDGYLENYVLNPDGSLRQGTPGDLAQQNRQATVLPSIQQYETQSPWRPAALERGFGSVASYPLLHNGQLYGVLSVYAAREYLFDRADVELLQELADDLGNAIANMDVRRQQVSLYAASENLPDALLIADLDGVITYANPGAARMLNTEVDQVIGRTLLSIVRPEAVDAYTAQEAILYAQGETVSEFDILVPGKGTLYLTVHAALVRDAHGQPYQIVIGANDVSSRYLYERQLLSLNRLSTELVEMRDREELLRRILVVSKEMLSSWAAAIFLVSPDDPAQITDFYRLNLPEAYARQILQGYGGLPGEAALRTKRPAFVEDTLDDPVYGDRVRFMAGHGIRSLLVLPVLYQDQPFGALVIYYDQPHAYPEKELQLAMTLAHNLAIALKNLSLYTSELSQRQLAEALAQAAASVNRFLKLDVVIDQILEQTMRLAGCNSTNIMMVEGDRARMVRRMGYDELPYSPGEEKEFIFPLASTPTLQRMLQSRQPLLIEDTAQELDWIPIQATEWIRSYASAPLQVGDDVVGFLNVDSSRPNFFTVETIRRLQMLADHAAIAIHNAQLYEASRRQAQELSTLFQAAETVTSSLNVEQVLTRLAEQMAGLVNAEGCAISDYNSVEGSVTLLANHEVDPIIRNQLFDQTFALRDFPVTRRVLDDNVPIQFHVHDVDIDPAEKELMQQGNVSTLLMLPIILHSQAIGLVEIESCDPQRVFTQAEITLLQTLAANAAHSINNARLYAQLQSYANELEDRVRQRTGELQAAKEHIEAILASVPDAVFVLDAQNKLVVANAAGEALMSTASQQGLDLFSEQFLEALKTGKLPAEKAVLHTQGHTYQALVSPMPMDPGSTGLVVVFRDVTRYHELDQMKTRFVSDVSHELRTPLTNIMLYLDLLSGMNDPQAAPGYLITLQRETRRLGDLIEDLLMISRLEAGRLNVNIKPLNINSLVSDLASDRARLAASRKLNLAFQPAENLPPAMADAGLLNQAVSNLLTNAILYTHDGGSIDLTTRLRQQDGQSWVTIEVSDTGTGIPAKELETIFDRFYRGSASRESGIPGTGLGLAIAREIILRLGGLITVESQVGVGSKFTIWLKAVL